MALSLTTNAQTHGKWEIASLYTVDNLDDTLHFVGYAMDSTGAVIATHPSEFKVDRDYQLYILWVDTLGLFVLDSIGLYKPNISKLEGMNINYEEQK